MKNASAPADAGQPLRARAESRIRADATPPGAGAQSGQELIHELRVHQIELEMQNDELRQAVHALEASRERYFELYDLAPLGYLSLSERGVIVAANLTAARLLRETRSALLRQPLSKFILPEDLGSYFQHRKKLFDTGEAQSSDLQLLSREGALSWIRLESLLIRSGEGAPLAQATMIDVTQAKATELLLARRTQELGEAEQRLARLARPRVCPRCGSLEG